MIPVTKCNSQLGWIWFAKGQRPLGDAILFDGASRGTFGSAKILTTSAFRYVTSWDPSYQRLTFLSYLIGDTTLTPSRSVVALGAVVTIGTLVAGPFFQQCVVFYSELSPHSDIVAYASFASTYNGSLGEWGHEPGM
jgi:hypothetical protein